MIYSEPEISVLILDFKKEVETRLCLESVKRHILIPHKVIYLHNGDEKYPINFFNEGLIDKFIQTKKNNGLGIGTRDLFAACFSKYALYLQNDQYLAVDINQDIFNVLKNLLNTRIATRDSSGAVQDSGFTLKSLSLAGAVCGPSIYSERAHLIETDFYKKMESDGILSYGGAGPYHDTEWRESCIQKYYKQNKFIHATHIQPFVIDNGRLAVRENPDGSVWKHQPDRKGLKLVSGPIKEKYVYPYFTDAEWEQVLKTQAWPDWQIPEKEKTQSFHVWN